MEIFHRSVPIFTTIEDRFGDVEIEKQIGLEGLAYQYFIWCSGHLCIWCASLTSITEYFYYFLAGALYLPFHSKRLNSRIECDIHLRSSDMVSMASIILHNISDDRALYIFCGKKFNLI